MRLIIFSAFIVVALFSYLWHDTQREKNTKKLNIDNAVALILARGGSKGIVMKNLAIIQNSTLLARTLNIVHQVKEFGSIWISTDDINIAREVNKTDYAKVHYRSPKSASDEATSIEATQEFLSYHSDVQLIALIQCTSPFLNVNELRRAYKMISKLGYDSVFSVAEDHKLRWSIHPNGTLYPLNFDVKRRPRRQDWSGELVENGMFYFVRTEIVLQNTLQGGKIGVVKIPQNRSLDINTKYDLLVANLMAPYHDSSTDSDNNI